MTWELCGGAGAAAKKQEGRIVRQNPYSTLRLLTTCMISNPKAKLNAAASDS